jgi:hypothetical protein
MDKSTATCLFLIRSYLDELLPGGTTFFVKPVNMAAAGGKL